MADSTRARLRLTTQVPLRIVYPISSRTRRISVGSHTVDLRHAPPWQLELASSRAGLAIRAAESATGAGVVVANRRVI